MRTLTFYNLKVYRITISVILLFITIGISEAQTTYYSWAGASGITDVTDLDAWRDDPSGDGSGNAPVDFLSTDEYRIINGDFMDASIQWVPSDAGKMNLVIEDGGGFDAGGSDHFINLSMEGSATYYKTTSAFYTNLSFATIENTSNFNLGQNTGFRYDLIYPNLIFSASTGTISFSQNITTTGNLEVAGGTGLSIRGAAITAGLVHTIGGSLVVTSGNTSNGSFIGSFGVGAPIINITGDILVQGGAFSGAGGATLGSPTFNIGGNIQVDGGTFNGTTSTNTGGGGSPNFNITGGINITGGTFNGRNSASGIASPTFNMGGDFSHVAGTYRGILGAATGIPIFNMNGGGSITAAGLTNSNHKFNINNTVNLLTDFTVGNTLTLSNGALNIGANTLTLTESLIVASGTLTGGLSSNITFGVATGITVVGANLPSVTLGNLLINRPGQQITLTGSTTIGTMLSITSGTLSIGANTLTLNGAFNSTGSLTGGTTSNIIIGGLAAAAINLPAITLNSLTVNRTNGIGLDGAITIGGTLFLTAGNIDNSVQTLTLGNLSTISRDLGSLSALPTFTGTVNVIYTGLTAVNSGYELPNVGTALNNLTVSKAGGVSLQSSIQVNGIFTINSGSQFSANAQPIIIMGGWVNNNIFNPNTGTVSFNGTTILSGSGSHNFNSIVINGSLTVPALSNVNISGDFTNNNTFNTNNGTLTFNGSGSQTIGGSTTTNFNNITISKASLASSVSLGSAQRLVGTLTLANSTSSFSTSGQTFTLVSNASGTARIAAVPTGAVFSGDINMQRYVAAYGGRYYHDISSPVSNATVSQWQAGAPTTGVYITGPFTGASNPGNGIKSTNPSMYIYNASSGSLVGYPSSSNTEAIVPKLGYRTFFRDANTGGTSAKTLSLAGTPNIGTQVFGLSYSATGGVPAGGWNLLGNPFPSDITADLTNPAWTKSGLAGNDVYILDGDMASYVSCNGGVGSCIIPSGQGFQVRAAGPGATLSATENVKVGGSTPLFRQATATDFMPIKLINTATSRYDKTYIRFSSDATLDFDGDYDAYKIYVDSVQQHSDETVALSTTANSIEYSINAKPEFELADTTDLFINSLPGSSSLDFSQTDNIASDVNIYLIDNYLNTVSDVKQNPIYNFEVNNSQNSKGNRFSVVYTKQTITTGTTKSAGVNSNLLIYPNPTAGSELSILLTNLKSSKVEVSILDLKGLKVYSENFSTNNGKLEKTINLDSSLSSGIYHVICKTDKDVYNQRLVIK